MTAELLATLAATTITESYDDLLPEIKEARETDFLAIEMRPTLFNVPTTDESNWRSIDGAVTYERGISVSVALPVTVTYERGISVSVALPVTVTSLFHDNSESCYFGALKTVELV